MKWKSRPKARNWRNLTKRRGNTAEGEGRKGRRHSVKRGERGEVKLQNEKGGKEEDTQSKAEKEGCCRK